MAISSGKVRRFGRVIRVRPEREEEYIRHHAAVWPGVLKTIQRCNIRNYSIFLKDHTLFAYFEYTGDDFEADMAKMAADPKTQEWWKSWIPCRSRFQLGNPASGGPRWTKCSTLIDALAANGD